MAKARSWLRNCLSTHDTCQKPESTYRPRRLVEIVDLTTAPILRLVTDSDVQKLHYATLSYCWGSERTVLLSKENLSGWKSSLPFRRLPQTIKDAIRVTNALGLTYLWVDALCIVQNDENDKLEQISQMADIYEQSLVTISAARAASAKDGFLRANQESGLTSFGIPFLCKDGRLGSISLWEKPGLGWNEPIERRAWTLQESALSPRMLEYGTNQLRWRCRSIPGGSAYVDGWTPWKIETMSHGIEGLVVIKERGTSISLPEDAFIRRWKDVVQNYSRRNLSDAGDKLLALAAIAKKFSQVSGHDYVAGLWRHALPELLLWRPMTIGEYPQKYVAPSWSWASITGSINFEGIPPIDVGMRILNIVVDTVVPNDNFSSISSASLQVSAMVRKVIAIPHQKSIIGKGGLSFWDPNSDGVNLGYGTTDVPTEMMDPEVWNQSVFLLLILPYSGLVLRKYEDQTYRRIGCFTKGAQMEGSQSVASRLGLNSEGITPVCLSWVRMTIVIV